MGWAAFIMAAGVLLSRFAGLIRDKVISFYFGATLESDIYFASFVVPDFINYLLAGAYSSITLIPMLSGFFSRDEREGWRFWSTVVTWVAIAITVLTVAAMAFAPSLARIAAPGLTGEASERLAFFLRIVLPAQIFFLIGSCFNALLFLRKQFFVPALTSVFYNLAIIFGGVVLHHRGMEGFCWGVLAGAFLANFLLPVLAAGRGGVRYRPSLKHPGLRDFALLALPLMLGQSVVVLDEQLMRIFGSLTTVGAISWLNYARRIMLVPVGVVAQAAGVASYPFLAELAARGEEKRFHETLNAALKNTLALLVPLSLWMAAIAGPTITLVFQQGRFGAEDKMQTALMLKIFLAAVFCWGIHQILARGFYARRDTLTPAIIGTAATAVCLPIYYGLSRSMGASGVAVAGACSVAIYAGALSFQWYRRFGKSAFAGVGKTLAASGIFSLAAFAPSHYAGQWASVAAGGRIYLGALAGIAAGAAAFAAVFVPLACFITPGLLRPFLEKLGPVGRRFLR